MWFVLVSTPLVLSQSHKFTTTSHSHGHTPFSLEDPFTLAQDNLPLVPPTSSQSFLH